MIADILLVDDNPTQSSTRKTILEKSGRTVVIANSAMEALDKLKVPEFSSTLGLVVTDHNMPGMNGPEFVSELRRRMPTVPVLVVSGMPDVEDQYASLNVVFRSKPFPPEQFISLTRALLDEPIGWTA